MVRILLLLLFTTNLVGQSTSEYTLDDYAFPSGHFQSLTGIRIIGYDNNTNTYDGDKLVLLLTEPYIPGTEFTLVNAVPSLNEDGERKFGDEDSKIDGTKIKYTGDKVIKSGTVLCIDLLDGGTEVVVRLNGDDKTNDFDINSGEPSSPLLSGDQPQMDSDSGGVMLLTHGKWFNHENENKLIGNILGGISIGNSATELINEAESNGALWESENTPILKFPEINDGYLRIICQEEKISLCEMDNYLYSRENFVVNIGSGIPASELNAANICEEFCGIDICAQDSIEILSDIDADSINIVFLMDNSSSVDKQAEYPLMKEAAKNTLLDLYNNGTNLSYSVCQFSDVNDFVVSISPTNDINQMTNLSYAFNSGTDVNSAFKDLKEVFDNGVLQTYASANIPLFLILLHDAPYSHMTESTPLVYPDLKKSPYKAIISVVRYDEENPIWTDPRSDPLSAGIASIGGEYTGPVENIPGDPEIGQLPRRFIKNDTFSSVIPGLLPSLQDTSLQLIIPEGCTNKTISWTSDTTGYIFSDTTKAHILTNGKGKYFVTVDCASGCSYTDTFVYAQDTIELRFFKDKNEITNESQYIHIYPNPFDTDFMLEVQTPKKINTAYLIDVNGHNIKGIPLRQHKSIHRIVLPELPAGLYYLKIGDIYKKIIKI